MKIAEEWAKFQHASFGHQEFLSKGDWKHVVEQIQLDSYKAGMSEAAEIAKYNSPAEQAILTARDNKTTLHP